MADSTVSRRARQFWGRLIAWYGARVADAYGTLPPPDWCDLIDQAPIGKLRRCWDVIKRDHPDHPPTLPQFEAILNNLPYVVRPGGANVQDQLRQYVLKHRVLTRGQLWQPWTFIYADGQCVAVEIPADGDVPGFRVRAEDVGA